jgi:rhodanese-related sulfurtransferase
MTPKSITVAELDALRAEGANVVVFDVRSPEEFAEGHVDGAVNVPAEGILAVVDDIDGPHVQVVTVCVRGGHRSQGAAKTLAAAGVNAVYLEGGTLAWMAAHGRRG